MDRTTKLGIATVGLALVVVLPTFGAQPAGAQEPWSQADLDGMAAEAREATGAPALGLAVVRPGGETQVAVAGVRCADEGAAVTPADLWHWGSITKSMTATLVARLVEKGIVSWDQTIGELLGDRVPDMRDAYRDVTFLHLLSHRGGIAPNIPVQAFAFFEQTPDDPIADRLRWVDIALKQDPVGPMGETYEYSNNGVIIAGAMLEAATGTPWEELIRREVFAPLGMASAGFGAPWDREPNSEPCGHRPVNGEDVPIRAGGDNPGPLGPAGRVHTSLNDMARFLAAHASGPTDFLSPESWNRLHTPPFGGNYALGWVVMAPEVRWHNGSNTTWYAEVAFLIGGGAAAVVVNDGDIASVQPAVRGLLSRLMGGQGQR